MSCLSSQMCCISRLFFCRKSENNRENNACSALVWGLQRSCAGRKWRWVDSATATYTPHTTVGALKLILHILYILSCVCAKFGIWGSKYQNPALCLLFTPGLVIGLDSNITVTRVSIQNIGHIIVFLDHAKMSWNANFLLIYLTMMLAVWIINSVELQHCCHDLL